MKVVDKKKLKIIIEEISSYEEELKLFQNIHKKKKDNNILKNKHQFSFFHTLCKELVDNDSEFYNFHHMTIAQFELLKSKVLPNMDSYFNQPTKISNEEKLVISIRLVHFVIMLKLILL